MSEQRTGRLSDEFWRLLCRIALVILCVSFFLHLRAIINTLLIGAILAYMFDPSIQWLQKRLLFHKAHAAVIGATHKVTKRGSPHPTHHTLHLLSTIYALLIGFVLCFYGVKLVAAPFQEQSIQIYNQREQYQALYKKRVPAEWREKIEKEISSEEFQKKALAFAMQGAVTLKYVVEVVLLPVLAFYFILDGRKLKREFLGLVPKRHFRETARMLWEFNQIMRSYVLGQFILCSLAGVVVGFGLKLIGVRYAFVLGVLAGVTRAIPIVGPIIGGIPIIGLTYLDDPHNGLVEAIAVLVFFTLLHFAESKVIMPWLIGERMELHPVIIIVVLLIGGEIGSLLLGGIMGALLGMFFAPPVAAILRVMICRYLLKRPHRANRLTPEKSP